MIFIIIPAFNEEKNIAELLSNINNLNLEEKIKVILVNDGSKDKTEEIAKFFINKMNLEIISHSFNQGVGDTFRDGLMHTEKQVGNDDIIAIIEGDNTSDLNLLPLMIKKIKDRTDLVIASRYIKSGGYKNFPFKRFIGSWLVNLVLKSRFRIKGVTDYTIFYRVYRAKIIKQAFNKYGRDFIKTKSFASNLEILLKVKEFCLKVGESPFVYNYGLKQGNSKINILKTLWEYKDLILFF